MTADIGTVGATGSADSTDGMAFTVAGAGTGFGSSSDAFRYVYQSGSGDCTVVAKVTGIENTDKQAGAFVMIRDSLNDNAMEASIAVTPSSGIIFYSRTATGGSTAKVTKTGLKAPYWLKIERTGNSFKASYSPDGSSWTVLGTQTITMGASTQIGLGVTSRRDSTLSIGTFSNVTATP